MRERKWEKKERKRGRVWDDRKERREREGK